jgi:hypothetical protein
MDWEYYQNQDIADLGGVPHVGSGNQWHSPSDGHRELFRFEHKCSLRHDVKHLETRDFSKIIREAVSNSMRPCVIVRMRDTVWAGIPSNLMKSALEIDGRKYNTYSSDFMSFDRNILRGWESLCLQLGTVPVWELVQLTPKWMFTPKETMKVLLDKWSEVMSRGEEETIRTPEGSD